MDRRLFMLGMGGATVTVATARTAGADSLANTPMHALLRVRFENGEFQSFDGFQIQSGGGTWGRDWSGDLRVFNEYRVDLGTAGGLLRRPFRVRWAEAVPIGPVFRIGSKLVGDAVSGGFQGYRVTVGADQTSWDLPRTLQPAIRYQERGHRVGSMRLGTDEQILVALDGRPAF